MNLTDITVTRTIQAPAEEVFDVWIDVKSPGGPWFGSEKVILNPVVDGLFYQGLKHKSRIWSHYGRFLVVDRPTKIEHTWVSEATKGMETVVSLAFSEHGGETEVTLTHSGVPDDEMGHNHKEGWTWVLSKLAEGFGEKPAATTP
jgi:uncharacterized protein YndB with AHSA1/START domain